MADTKSEDIVSLASDIVSAFVSKNAVPPTELSGIIASVHAALSRLANGTTPVAEAPPPEPAVSIRKSVGTDFIICLEDGKKFKSLKRHLRTAYDLSPEEYRAKWKLPKDYPMVAPSYASQRSELAKQSGLGNQAKGRRTAKRARKAA